MLLARFDSSTKFMVVPLAVWGRLNQAVFSHNGCSEDSLKNTLCECSGTWKTIEFDLVKDPSATTLDANVATVKLPTSSYLEETSSGKCLLLIKPRESDARIDYTLGTSVMQNFYSIFNLEKDSITLAISHGIVPARKSINNNFLIPFAIVASVLALLLTGILFAILRKVKLSQEDLTNASSEQKRQPPVQRNISYLVSSPREIESI